MSWLRSAWTWLRKCGWWLLGLVILPLGWLLAQLYRRQTAGQAQPEPPDTYRDLGRAIDKPRERLNATVTTNLREAADARRGRNRSMERAQAEYRRAMELDGEAAAKLLLERQAAWKAKRDKGLHVVLPLLCALLPSLARADFVEPPPAPQGPPETVCLELDYARHLLGLDLAATPGMIAHGQALLEIGHLSLAVESLQSSVELADVSLAAARREAQAERDLRVFAEDSAAADKRRVRIRAGLWGAGVAVVTAALGVLLGAVAR